MPSKLSEQIQPFHVMELVKQADALTNMGKSVIHLSIGEPDFALPAPVSMAYIEALRSNRTGYTQALGLPQLREAISGYYQSQFQVDVPTDQIVITSGASAALQYACLALINPGDDVLLTDPGYPCNKTFVQLAGGVPVAVEVNEKNNFQPDWHRLESHWTNNTSAVLLASPSNPTGTQLGAAAMEAIAHGVGGKGRFLIVDEIYQCLSYDSPARSILQITGKPTAQNRLVVINSFSKYFGMTGLRLGWMVVPKELVPNIERLAQNLSICPSTPAQWAALACFTPDTLGICEERRRLFKERRDFMIKALPAAGIQIDSRPDSAFYIYAKTPLNSDDYCQRLLNEALVCAVPGKDFSESNGDRMMRLSYANSMANLQEAVRRLQVFNQGL